MNGLSDFVEVDDTTTYHLFNIEYTEEYGKPVVHLFCRDKNDEKHHIEVEGHRPSFYIEEDAYSKRVKNHDWVVDAERGYESIHGQPLIRIFAQLPKHIGGDGNRKGLRNHFEKTWEADVYYNSRFLIDSGIKTHFEVPDDVHKSASKGDFRVDYSDIEPVDSDWRATPRMITIDIEVLSPDGFPEPQSAEQPVTAITAHDNHTDDYTVWVLRCDGWNLSDTEVKNKTIENRPNSESINAVEVYEDESRMLDSFNNYVNQMRPDLLSGWNSSASDMGQGFDYPYLIHRCQKCNVSSYIDWSPLEQVWDGSWGPTAKGVGFFDMLKAYKKTQWSKPKGGYGLENIAQKELDYGKEDIDDIDEAWKSDVGTFLKYNIRDVSAVLGINEEAEVLEMFQNLRALTGAQFQNTFNNIDLLDVFILRYAKEFDICLPTNEEPARSWYYGAHVFEPKFGRHENVVYPDVWSLYPNQIRNVNMSPETLIGTEEELEESEYTEEDCRWAYIDTRRTALKQESDPEYEKLYFVDPSIKEGFMTSVVDDLMGMKDKYDGTDLYGAVKRVVNSCFTPDTEILTPDGVKNVTEFEVGDDVYAMDEETGEMEVKSVINTVEKPDYSGELVEISNGRMHHTVTPDHDMVVENSRYKDEWEIVEAGNLNQHTRYRVPTTWEYDSGSKLEEYPLWKHADVVYIEPDVHGHTFVAETDCGLTQHSTGSYNGYEVPVDVYEEHEEEIREMADRVLCRCENRERRTPAYINGSAFTQLAAWYTTEGSISSTTSERVIISQQDTTGRKCIEKAMKKCNLRYRKSDVCLSVTSEVLSKCFVELFGSGSFNKQFPKEFRRKLSTDQLRLAAVTFIQGDGRWSNETKHNARYTTCCETLRDDVLALFIECGHIARYQEYTSQAGTDGWRIHWRREANHQFSLDRSGNKTDMETYASNNGESGVYCITVEDNHTVIAGRNGKLSAIRQCYGVFGDSDSYGKGYRMFDWRIAEGITLVGRKQIQDTAVKYVDELNNIKEERGYDGNNAYLVLGDTDSVATSIPFVDEGEEVLDISQEATQRVNDWYSQWAADNLNLNGKHYCELEIESYSPYLFVPEPKTASAEGKKRYAQITAWEEGEWYDEPEFSATGIDIVRSDRAEVTRDVAEDVIDTILRTDDRSKVREKVYERLNTVVTDIKNGDVENSRLARPKGMGQPPEEYGSLSNTPQPTYRGAKYANQHFAWENMDEGSKPALLYIDKVRGDYPRTYTADTREGGKKVDAVALEEPNKLPEAFTIDYDKMVEKVVEDPLNPILAAMGWSVDEALADSSQGELSRFM